MKIMKDKKQKKAIVRTCIITRKNDFKENLLRFVLKNNNEYYFDEKQKFDGRGIYIVKDLEVFQKLIKKYNINLESMERILKLLKNINNSSIEEKIYSILQNLKMSPYLVYGLTDNIESIKLGKTKLLIIPSDINGKTINKFKKLANVFNVKIVFINSKKIFLEIFSKDVSIVGIINKKVVKGIINKMEVEK